MLKNPAHPLALPFQWVMQADNPALSFFLSPYNRSLSLHSPHLNWSILHLNHDISTLQLEKTQSRNTNAVSWLNKRYGDVCFGVFLTSDREEAFILLTSCQDRGWNICKRSVALGLIWAAHAPHWSITYLNPERGGRVQRRLILNGKLTHKRNNDFKFHM